MSLAALMCCPDFYRKRLRMRPADAQRYFRHLQLLNIHFNSCCSDCILPNFLLTSILLTSSSLFMIIRLNDSLPTVGLVAFTMVSFAWFLFDYSVLPSLGKINFESRQFKMTWMNGTHWRASGTAVTNVTDVKGIQKELKRTRELTCKVGGFFTLDWETNLKFFSAVAEVTLNGILLF